MLDIFLLPAVLPTGRAGLSDITTKANDCLKFSNKRTVIRDKMTMGQQRSSARGYQSHRPTSTLSQKVDVLFAANTENIRI